MGTDHLHFHPKIMSTGYLWKWFNLRAGKAWMQPSWRRWLPFSLPFSLCWEDPEEPCKQFLATLTSLVTQSTGSQQS